LAAVTFHAHAARAQKSALVPFDYEPSPLGAHDVEIGITHCGICHSDVHLVDGDWGMGSYPMVPGHEIVGTVAAVGPEAAPLKPGDRVGVGWQRGACLQCDACLSGDENLCAGAAATCVDNHGGFADGIRLDGRFAFPIPEALSSEAAAPLLCGGVTVYCPLRRWVRPSMRVGVVGIGGLGHLALQFASAMGCEVAAISSSPDKEPDARTFGAHAFLATRDPKALRSARGTLDFILSTVFVPQDWTGLLGALRPNGILCLVGGPAEPLIVPAFALIGGQKTVTASVIGGRPAIREMLEFAARHGIAARTERRPLADANEALDHVRSGRARYRVVLAA
jgi:alcohol/geraniol dehydrogenase (NADP+)